MESLTLSIVYFLFFFNTFAQNDEHLESKIPALMTPKKAEVLKLTGNDQFNLDTHSGKQYYFGEGFTYESDYLLNDNGNIIQSFATAVETQNNGRVVIHHFDRVKEGGNQYLRVAEYYNGFLPNFSEYSIDARFKPIDKEALDNGQKEVGSVEVRKSNGEFPNRTVFQNIEETEVTPFNSPNGFTSKTFTIIIEVLLMPNERIRNIISQALNSLPEYKGKYNLEKTPNTEVNLPPIDVLKSMANQLGQSLSEEEIVKYNDIWEKREKGFISEKQTLEMSSSSELLDPSNSSFDPFTEAPRQREEETSGQR